jgi:hypothetical protein
LKVWLALIVLWAAAVPAFAQTDSDTNGTGTSHGFAVSDGDTVKFGRQRVRLFGIDAPEKTQPCDGGHWYPGPLAGTDGKCRLGVGLYSLQRPVCRRPVAGSTAVVGKVGSAGSSPCRLWTKTA